MDDPWQWEVERIHTTATAIKKSGIIPWSVEDQRFLALALGGEVGELQNMIKKEWRGDGDFRAGIKKELADIRVYLHLLATSLTIDLDEAVEEKLPEIRAKFPTKEKT
jgi:NTP pyrophosphatase (non-canonical NTP hydrolase)